MKTTVNSKDQTKYVYDGYFYQKNSLVFELISQVIKKYDYEVLNELLPVKTGFKLITKLHDARKQSTRVKRYFLNVENILVDKNGHHVCVTNQWTRTNVEKFIMVYRMNIKRVQVKRVN